MFKSVIYLFVFVVTLNLVSCSDTNKNSIIKFSNDSTSVIVKNIDETSLFEVKKAYQSDPDSVNFISVVLIPNDTDSLQDERTVPGKTVMQGDSLVFTPDKPFFKGETYLVENYIGIKFADGSKLLKGSVKYNLKPQKQLLKR